MIISTRRMNILQVVKMAGENLRFTPADLKQAGAYGSLQHIHRALRGMMKHGAVKLTDGKWHVTPQGWLLAGMVPAKT